MHAAPRVQAAQAPAAVSARRMTVLLFDLTSMSADDVDRAANQSLAFVDQNMLNGDLVSVLTASPSLRVVSDFTSDPAGLRAALTSSALQNGTLNGSPLPPQRDANPNARLEAIKTVCQTIAPLQQRKALMYFSSGVAGARSGASAEDRAVLDAVTDTCRRANVLIYPVDSRGLAAMQGGSTQGQGGAGLFNGGGR
jgi:VWFA-related protein